MYIPVDAEIKTEKLTHYLLVPRPKNDKSKFLAKAGFVSDNADMLEVAIRLLIQSNEAIEDHRDDYGIFYQVTGKLVGPDGELDVVTIWVMEPKDNDHVFRFITLKPRREKS